MPEQKPLNRPAGVEVTPAMIEAGVDALCSTSDESVSCRPVESVAEVYAAMETARGDVEPTPAMITAGGAVLEKEIPGAVPTGRCQSVAEDVFMAMIGLLR